MSYRINLIEDFRSGENIFNTIIICIIISAFWMLINIFSIQILNAIIKSQSIDIRSFIVYSAIGIFVSSAWSGLAWATKGERSDLYLPQIGICFLSLFLCLHWITMTQAGNSADIPFLNEQNTWWSIVLFYLALGTCKAWRFYKSMIVSGKTLPTNNQP